MAPSGKVFAMAGLSFSEARFALMNSTARANASSLRGIPSVAKSAKVVDHIGAQREISQETSKQWIRYVCSSERSVENDLSSPCDRFSKRRQRIARDWIKDNVSASASGNLLGSRNKIFLARHDDVISSSIEQRLLLGR